MRYLTLLLLACAGVAAAACGNSTGLQAFRTNVVDTVSLYALSGTLVSKPSGYAILNGPVRTEQVVSFDFAFKIDPPAGPFFFPPGPLNPAPQPVPQITKLPSDLMRIAPMVKYE